MSRRRHLRPEEEEIWQIVARSATPMHAPRTREVPPGLSDIRPPALKEKSAKPDPIGIEPFRVGEKAVTAMGHGFSGQAPEPSLRMDAKAFSRMSRGKLAPETRIDLHGMTLSQAHPALVAFIMNAYSHGVRLALVITGKGKETSDANDPLGRSGILRRQVPYWLAQQPMSHVVLQVVEAHVRHGGSGACYVYLRRTR